MDLETTSRGDKCPGVCLSTAWLIYGILQSPPLHVSTLLLGVVGEGLFWKYSGKVVLSSVFVGVSLRKDRLPMRPFHEDHSASYLSFLLYPPKSNFRPLSFNFDIVLKKLFVFLCWFSKDEWRNELCYTVNTVSLELPVSVSQSPLEYTSRTRL